MEFNAISKLLLVSSLAVFTAHAQLRTQWCEDGHDHHDNKDSGHVLPHPEDLLKTLFSIYGENSSCTIAHEGFEEILHDLEIGGHNHGPDPHDDEEHDVTCFDGHDLLSIHNISEDNGLAEVDFIQISPTLLEQLLHGCANHVHDVTETPPTAGEVWGYGLTAVIIISAFSLLAVPVARWQHTPAYKYILTAMLGLAVGTLSGDAIMHLLPHGLGLHDHSSDDTHSHEEESSIDVSVWKSFCTCLTILGFLNLQMLFTYFHKDVEQHPTLNTVSPEIITVETTKEKAIENGSVHKAQADSDLNLSTTDSEANLVKKAPESMAWMVVIGDIFHNFADGLALGAAFSDSWQLGLSTSVAVFCHELPHEFGDVAAMFSVGWSWKRVILMQCLTQSAALVGLCVGIPVAEESEGATQWILMLAAGMFLYVALCDIVPELLGYLKLYKPVYIILMTNMGLLLGFTIMLVISILEQLYGTH